MAKKKSSKTVVEPDQILEQGLTPEEAELAATEGIEETQPEVEEKQSIPAPGPKFPVGSIVFVAKHTSADLNGFKLFPQYKKYTYTVEAYDDEKAIYTLRRLNLSLKLKEADIVAPSEKESCPLARKQY